MALTSPANADDHGDSLQSSRERNPSCAGVGPSPVWQDTLQHHALLGEVPRGIQLARRREKMASGSRSSPS